MLAQVVPLRLGRLFVAVAMAAFGAQYALFAAGKNGPTPGPPWAPGAAWSAWMMAFLLVAGAATLAVSTSAGWGALGLGTLFLVRVMLVHAPALASTPRAPGPWTSAGEVLAIGGGAWVMAAQVWAERGARGRAQVVLAEIGRFLFAAPLVVFGVQHWMYARFVAGLVPAWIPGHLFWAYGVGAAFIASAVAIATRTFARLAATCLGIMFFLWVVVLHLPRSFAAAENGNEWTSTFVALAMSGCAFALASVPGARSLPKEGP
jgi:hypothetical protein